jgi:hypothetical protein
MPSNGKNNEQIFYEQALLDFTVGKLATAFFLPAELKK